MATAVLMPQLGLTMTEGLIMEWKKREGETVKKGEVLFDVENDKATIDVEAQVDGELAKIIVAEKVTVPVGTIVGYIAASGEKIPEVAKLPPQKASAQLIDKADLIEESQDETIAKAEMASRDAAGTVKRSDGFVLASPFARKAAESLRIDLASVVGTGPDGAVIGRDLPASGAVAKSATAAMKPAAKLSLPASNVPFVDVFLSRIGKIAAERMTESWTTIPQFTLYDEAEADILLRLAERYKKGGEPVSLTAILAKLLAHAAQSYPLVNASWIGEGKVRTFASVNVNIAMDTPDGLVVPVLRDCAMRSFKALGADLKLLGEKAKGGALAPLDYEGGTITLSNLGMFGIQRFRAIVNPPQTAILAVGALSDKVVAGTGGGFESKKFLEYSITADHRAVDGAYAARFMASLKSLIENPLLTMD